MQTSGTTAVVPPSDAHTATVIFIHGLGQSNATWTLVVKEALAPSLPFVKWVLPQARSDVPVSYYQGNRRPSWFDISELPPSHFNVHENCDQIQESISIIESLILEEVHRGVDPRRIALVGFSQGAALSLMVSFSTLYELGGVVSLSGWVPHRARPLLMASNIPVLWCHGTSDDEIPFPYGEEAYTYLRTNLGLPYQLWSFRSYDGLSHAIRTDELEDVVEWLERRFAA